MKTYSSMELIKILESDGWYFFKANSSHHHFKHLSKKGKVTIPRPRKDMPTKTVKSILQQAGINI
ncbi:type II toxin-antitoxin system HicA family toxin [Serpentinicella alkaliphila]|uniref:Putative RNA binding protein YcfA (HicA-like mRNA interferase family) n=1 Tax=Serpentinicella alkaliphila TaxID=1734049 RepID=A0A4R2TIR3_9FIRM|nr:type II toxin-antitoxin system HicA family toxin [Serpentinicella alkaliphila]QUH26162.1 type II toxin-antitoxin system HicA family toxin [Serpentinicella alkaliphila]TCP94692.1 putative RNA binding protein YcfA (HicA-like mRNA interferase family) [Serpentinicella alkaliphila]